MLLCIEFFYEFPVVLLKVGGHGIFCLDIDIIVVTYPARTCKVLVVFVDLGFSSFGRITFNFG